MGLPGIRPGSAWGECGSLTDLAQSRNNWQSGSNSEAMDKLDAMSAFTKVVAAGSYAEAARQLGLTRSAVSKAVMEIEALLGARLLDRTTRKVTPTEAGRAYYER